MKCVRNKGYSFFQIYFYRENFVDGENCFLQPSVGVSAIPQGSHLQLLLHQVLDLYLKVG